MAVMMRTFEQIAEVVADRTAELLEARVWILDDRGAVIGSSEPQGVGLSFDTAVAEPGNDYLRVPVHLGAQDAEIVVACPENGEVVSPRLGSALVDLVINQAAMVAELPNRHELKNKFIHDLLRGRINDESHIVREGQILGMDLTLPRAVVLIDASEYILASDGYGRAEVGEARIPRRAQFVIASIVGFFSLPNDPICAYIGDGEIAVNKASSTQDLVAWTDNADDERHQGSSWANLTALKRASSALLTRLRHDTRSSISIGIGRYHPGIGGLARSYQDAQAALLLGRRFQGSNQVHCLDSLGVAAFIGVPDERTKADLATHLLSPLDHEPELHETLHAFFRENCCASSTANTLCIHRNTLSYRLDKISFLTGLDPRRFDDAVQIRLALLVRTLQALPA